MKAETSPPTPQTVEDDEPLHAHTFDNHWAAQSEVFALGLCHR